MQVVMLLFGLITVTVPDVFAEAAGDPDVAAVRAGAARQPLLCAPA